MHSLIKIIKLNQSFTVLSWDHKNVNSPAVFHTQLFLVFHIFYLSHVTLYSPVNSKAGMTERIWKVLAIKKKQTKIHIWDFESFQLLNRILAQILQDLKSQN